jgi:ABC-type multidrug transport system ATPase subunit
MSEKILRALMRLFAIIAKSDENSYDARSVVASFLKQQLNKEQVKEYLSVYDQFLKQQSEESEGEKKKRRLAVSSVKVIVICNQINEELNQKQKFIVLLNLIEFVNFKESITGLEMEFLATVASSFNIPEEEFLRCLNLATQNNADEVEDTSDFLIAGNKRNEKKNSSKFFQSELLSGNLIFLRIGSIGIYLVRYLGEAELFLNGQIITPGRIYIFSQGSSLRSHKVQPIFYNEIVGCFLNDVSGNKIVFEVNNLEYKFKSGKIGLHPLSFKETSGSLLGVMGGSGAGKSTLLNILNGNNRPSAGSVLINGYNLHDEKDKLEGVIGYVPQDDLLIEELTVYQNLFYSSKLCFGSYSDDKIHQLVLDMLTDLGLSETADLKVGNSLDKTISGGQRKRLNIALELIREPAILFVDEPTSGLSSRDSENIMDLLKELSLKGKLVFVVIHQPSSDIFKMFDKLLILDNGGYPIYYGNPVESVVYFKTLISQVNANESQCITCGNVNPEQVFNIIELKVLDENGNQTRNRKVSPKEWNEFYSSKNTGIANEKISALKQAVKNTFKKPDFLKQFNVFITRDVLAKLSNKQYLAINFFEAPLLAFILAFLIKYYKNSGEYIFSENKNLPAYLFMAVIVALFIGLTVSAEEIIRDRKLLKREAFLNLSRSGYLFSKTSILFFVSAVQTFTFVLIGNYILGIKDMYLDYWLVLFTTSCFANVLGLNISSAFNSVVTIYILIPFLIIPQLLLSGVIVKFEELNPKLSSHSVVPVSGEIMASRWAFEALAVNQFVNNDYEKNIYQYEKESSNAGFKKVYWCFKMNELLDELKKKNDPSKIELVKNEIKIEMLVLPEISFQSMEKINSSGMNETMITELKQHVDKIKKHYSLKYDEAVKAKDNWIGSLSEQEHLVLHTNYFNKKLESMVRNIDTEMDIIIEENGKLIAVTDPVFRAGSDEHFIRSHFFAPSKNVLGNYYSTFWVNVIVIWAMTLFLWICLYFDVLRKLLELFSKK